MTMQQILSSNCWPDRAGNRPRWIIIHGTAGFETPQQVAVFFASTASDVSAHYVIGRDGMIIQCVLETAAAWANGGITGTPLDTLFTGVGDGVHRNSWWNPQLNPNLVTISIEHVKPSTDNSDELTVEQTTASFALIDSICTRWNIPRQAATAGGGITGHFSMDPVNKSHCPGPYPWDALWQYLAGSDMLLPISDPFAARYFVQVDVVTWHCTVTGINIHDAILAYWRKTQGAFRLPVSQEIYGVIPGGSFQCFEGGVLVYDPAGKFDNPGQGSVYAMHLDKDTPGLRRLIGAAGLVVQAAPPVKIDGDTLSIFAIAAEAESKA